MMTGIDSQLEIRDTEPHSIPSCISGTVLNSHAYDVSLWVLYIRMKTATHRW